MFRLRAQFFGYGGLPRHTHGVEIGNVVLHVVAAFHEIADERPDRCLALLGRLFVEERAVG
jgi:hypothetical protein